MRYKIEHLTRYDYSQPVGLSFQIAHLCPRDTDYQRCLAHTLEIEPAPARIDNARKDYFGNPLTQFEIASAHDNLLITARSEVDIERTAGLPEESPDWHSVSTLFAEPQWGPGEDNAAAEFIFPSTHIPHLPALREYAAASFKQERPIVEAAIDLMARIHEDFEFDPEATLVSTPVEKVFEIRRGVCQDFAHFMITCLRTLGLPARYMSGYLLTEPPPGKPRLVGADASHAWIALYVPGSGWLELDPTNDIVPGESHITLGWGRDFADVSPLRGVILGGGEHEVKVGVTVTPLD